MIKSIKDNVLTVKFHVSTIAMSVRKRGSETSLNYLLFLRSNK